jgi:hypothetical protein
MPAAHELYHCGEVGLSQQVCAVLSETSFTLAVKTWEVCSSILCTIVMEEGCQKYKRLSYTAKFKHEVIQCAEKKGKHKGPAVFGVDESSV